MLFRSLFSYVCTSSCNPLPCHFRYWSKQSVFDEDQIIGCLSTGLRQELLVHLNHSIIERVPLFQGRPIDFTAAFMERVKPVFFNCMDCIYLQGDTGHAMYIIADGSVNLYLYPDSQPFSSHSATKLKAAARTVRSGLNLPPDGGDDPRSPAVDIAVNAFQGKSVKKCERLEIHLPSGPKELDLMLFEEVHIGDFFGEFALLNTLNTSSADNPNYGRRAFTAVSMLYSELYVLRRPEFEELMGLFPRLREYVCLHCCAD